MRKRMLLAAVLAGLMAGTIAAQEILTTSTRIVSDNGQWAVELSERANKTVQMSMVDAVKGESLWSAWIDWRASAYGYVANDGSAFVVIESEYADDATPITVFTKGKREAYSVKALPIAREFLLLMANRLYWIEPRPAVVRFVYDGEGRATGVDLRMVNEKLIRVRVSQPDLAAQ